VAAGAYPDVRSAADAMGKVTTAVYTPNQQSADAYDALFEEYSLLHDYFGRGGNDVMHRLKAMRRVASSAAVMA
jgi:L-ribulokinase